MSKKRPSTPGWSGKNVRRKFISKTDLDYWFRRLFRNTYTRKGQRIEVNSWAVKIQKNGQRKTITLHASRRKQAALEALETFKMISSEGWNALAKRTPWLEAQFSAANHGRTFRDEKKVEYWKRKLVKRPYPKFLPEKAREFTIYLEYEGVSHYFPLGTNIEDEAAMKAAEIYKVVSRQGWKNAVQQFPRELALALRWLDNPVAWTYTTLHTWKTAPFNRQKSQFQDCERRVAIVEPDPGLQLAFASSLSQQEGVRRCDAYSNIAEMTRALRLQPVDLVLVNSRFREVAGIARFSDEGQLATIAEACSTGQILKDQTIMSVFYSVFEDADQLFKCTPGGAVGYMLKRTPLNQLLAPIAGTSEPLTPKQAYLRVRKYFKELVLAMPSAPLNENIIKLTPRELEILSQLAKGYVTKEIAAGLAISSWTVNGHVKSILEKLRVHTRTEAVVRYLEPIV